MNPGDRIHLGSDAMVMTGVYLAVMIIIGFLGKFRRKEESLKDFYLGGSSFGYVILFLTFFATQYSGNTILGFAGQAYKQGAAYIFSVTFMILVISVYLLYAPRLYKLSKRFNYITPTDFIYHRFGSRPLHVIACLLMLWGLGNYILEQLVAMGHALSAISDGRIAAFTLGLMRGSGMAGIADRIEAAGRRDSLEFMLGVVLLALTMMIYESLGGMRSVAWTDAVQGLLLLGGFGAIFYILLTTRGGLPGAAEIIMRERPQVFEVPAAPTIRSWFSNLALFGLGIAVYPHAVQRIFAAGNLRALRLSVVTMAFMPFVTTLFAFFAGIVGLSHFPNLPAGERDRITLYVLSEIVAKDAFSYWLVVMVFVGVIAAIMSTADSALLSFQSMVTKDLYKTYFNPGASGPRLLWTGKLVGWFSLGFLILMAYVSLETQSSIWRLIKLKVEFMAQIAPLFILGVSWRRLPTWAALAGVVCGTAATLIIWVWAIAAGLSEAATSPWGINAGVWGLALNFGVCLLGGWFAPDKPKPAPIRNERAADDAAALEKING